ncbi:MAG: MFS transporter, partial [Actinomycetota bacterium]|nr:MFS transporter [Actinomycetota bacterium]
VVPSLMTLAMSGASEGDAGLASGLINTSVQVGGALGLAVLATLSTTRTENALADGASVDAALVDGYHLAFWLSAGLVALATLIAATQLRTASAVVDEPVPLERDGAPAAALDEAA